METQTLILTLGLIAGLFVAGLWLHQRKQQTFWLRAHFGAEYDQAVARAGSQARAEAELKALAKYARQLDIIRLPVNEEMRFSEAWNSLQSKFVDDPRVEVVEADRLVVELMRKRGYPVSHFEQLAIELQWTIQSWL